MSLNSERSKVEPSSNQKQTAAKLSFQQSAQPRAGKSGAQGTPRLRRQRLAGTRERPINRGALP
jgi:hypothetical protein